MGVIKALSDASFLDSIKKGITAAKLRAAFTLVEQQLTEKTEAILRPISFVAESTNSVLNIANPYPANTLATITVYKQIYVTGVATEIGYREVIPTSITKNVALQNDSYKIEGLADGKYHIVFSPAAEFTPYSNS
ncbi:hypothetical protein WAF17_10890 [Bernardetia sp. ABR2-2B]|uniref:hypothetical protein n=1 Tax=Bernardetia sp. ABR2-2B TaxID=3127472 RepID=UPI0030CF9E0B